ncbi:uncharacterized protein B0H64DRAFT_218663 [Chaetomium fimeti]|uniref:Uncharacterized protein n=1 Tax=Chaetomium fimeti TaxID=1854472 RepID=A0AAE0LQH3_9PEZI|nr:hypothetical protein B0H64DRAFT_218663 [Chaetomium fimeti]
MGLKIACCRQANEARWKMEQEQREDWQAVGEQMIFIQSGPRGFDMQEGARHTELSKGRRFEGWGTDGTRFQVEMQAAHPVKWWVGMLGKTRLWRLWCGARHTANPLTPGQARGDDCPRINGVTDKGFLGEALIECPWRRPPTPDWRRRASLGASSGSPMLRDESEGLEICQGCALEERSAPIRRIVVKGLCLFQQNNSMSMDIELVELPDTMKCHARGPSPRTRVPSKHLQWNP